MSWYTNFEAYNMLGINYGQFSQQAMQTGQQQVPLAIQIFGANNFLAPFMGGPSSADFSQNALNYNAKRDQQWIAQLGFGGFNDVLYGKHESQNDYIAGIAGLFGMTPEEMAANERNHHQERTVARAETAEKYNKLSDEEKAKYSGAGNNTGEVTG